MRSIVVQIVISLDGAIIGASMIVMIGFVVDEPSVGIMTRVVGFVRVMTGVVTLTATLGVLVLLTVIATNFSKGVHSAAFQRM